MTDLTTAELRAVIEMAWDDDTSFDAIELQTGLLEKDVIAIMRREMKPSSFRMWRKRVTGRASKHRAKIQD
ncbi:MAG: TIGR03643 family protein [Henriciella sp.]